MSCKGVHKNLLGNGNEDIIENQDWVAVKTHTLLNDISESLNRIEKHLEALTDDSHRDCED